MAMPHVGAKQAPTELRDALQYTPLVSLVPVQSGMKILKPFFSSRDLKTKHVYMLT